MNVPIVVVTVLLTRFLYESREIFVAPDGTATGTGSLYDPWDIYSCFQTLYTKVFPGDVIWIRGGDETHPYIYVGRFSAQFKGNSTHPIIVRNYNNERVIIDGKKGEGTYPLYEVGEYTWYWGLEFMVSREKGFMRWNETMRGIPSTAVKSVGYRVKFINCILHDAGSGMYSTATLSRASENYGNIIYYNGFDSEPRVSGVGIYFQNERNGEPKILEDCIFFKGFRSGIHAYSALSHGVQAYLDNLWIIGNTVFDPSGAGTGGGYALILGGSLHAANGSKVKENMIYVEEGHGGAALSLGVQQGLRNGEIHDNYVHSDSSFINLQSCDVRRNTFIGNIYNFVETDYPDNQYYSYDDKLNSTIIFMRPNKYEKGRAHITVFNHLRLKTIRVNLSDVLEIGDCYTIKDVENLFGEAVSFGKYEEGSMVEIPMTFTECTEVEGETKKGKIEHTDLDFGCFVVTKRCWKDKRKIRAFGFVIGISFVSVSMCIVISVIVFCSFAVPMLKKRK